MPGPAADNNHTDNHGAGDVAEGRHQKVADTMRDPARLARLASVLRLHLGRPRTSMAMMPGGPILRQDDDEAAKSAALFGLPLLTSKPS